MKNKFRFIKEHKYVKKITQISVPIIVISLVAIFSFVNVMAGNVSYFVTDRGEEYIFTLKSSDEIAMMDKLYEMGMEKLSPKDEVIKQNGTIQIKRAADVIFTYQNEFKILKAFEGETVAEVLDREGFVLTSDDTLSVELDAQVYDKMKVICYTENQIYITDNDVYKKLVITNGTVQDVLDELNIVMDSTDQVSPSVDTNLSQGMQVVIERNFDISFKNLNDETVIIKSTAKNVEDFIKEQGIQLTKDDKLNVELNASLESGMEIIRTSSSVVYTEEKVSMSFTTKYVDDPNILKGQTKIQTFGSYGEKVVKTAEKWENGEFVSKEVVSETITKNPVNQVVLRGTKTNGGDESVQPSGSTFIDMYGNTVSYSNKMVGSCTAYCIPGGITSTGRPAQVGVVAVNPNVIPYGTKMYITSGSVVYGYAVAGDTGGAAMANHILVDLYYNTREEAIQFGRRDMTVYFLD